MPKGKQSLIIHISDEQFTKYVQEATSWFDLMTKCGYKAREHKNTLNEVTLTQQTTAKPIIRKRIIQMGLTTEHFETARRCKTWRHVNKLTNKRRHSNQLKKILDQVNRCYVCAICRCEGMTLWNGEWLWHDWPLKLQIDHINGRHGSDEDDHPDNLRYLCPNCHSQTPTFTGKNGQFNKQTHRVKIDF